MRPSKTASALLAAALALLSLTASIAVPILCRPFYYLHIGALDLPERTGWTAEVIREAYDQVLDFCVLGAPFGTGELAWSEAGRSHFADVRGLFLLDFALAGAAAAVVLALFLLHRARGLEFARLAGRGPAFWAGTGAAAAVLLVAGLAALALIGGLVVLAFTKLYGTVFLGAPRSHEVAEASEVDSLRIAAMALPLAGILFVGLFPRAAVTGVTHATGFFLRTPPDAADWLLSPTLTAAGRVAWLLIVVAALLLWLRRRTLRGRRVAEGPTWGCGFTSPNVRMQYTGESFSEGLQSIATSLTQNSGEGSPVGKGEIFPDAHRFDIGHRDRIGRLFSAWWVELLRLINQRVMRLRTGKINHYVLFALAFLVLVFLLSICNVI